MYPNLMSASSLGTCSDDTEGVACRATAESSLDRKFRPGRCARRMNGLLKPDERWGVNSLPGQRSIHQFGIPFRPAPDDGEIFLRDALLLHQQTKTSRRGPVLRDQDESARFPIEPVHDRNLSAVRDFEGEQVFQFAPERGRIRRFRGMNEQKWRLVDDDEVVCSPRRL